MSEPAGILAEVFASYQGEGPWIGFQQVFVRLAGCHLGCRYCDTRWASQPPKTWRLTLPNGRVTAYPNPVTPEELIRKIERFWKNRGAYHSLAITGGEPLEQPEFLEAFVCGFKQNVVSVPILLETNGLHAIVSRKMKVNLDFVSMDIKLGSASGAKLSHSRMSGALASASSRPGCAKVVVVPGTSLVEIRAAGRMALQAVPDWDLVLQPAHGWDWRKHHGRLLGLMRAASAVHPRTRLIPQMHRTLGLP